jgi:hypothetical protein
LDMRSFPEKRNLGKKWSIPGPPVSPIKGAINALRQEKNLYRAPNPYSTGCSIAVKCIYHDVKTFQMDTLYKRKSRMHALLRD